MPKILIIGPRFHNYNRSIANAFEQPGWNSVIEDYDTPVHPFKGLVKWKHKFSTNKKKLRERQKIKYKSYIEQKYSKILPDLVLILNGEILFPDTLDFFRKKSKIALWLFDSLTNIPAIVNHINHVDFCFCYEQEDVNFYAQQGKTAYFLPQAYDPKLYHKESTLKDIDILFVGDLYFSKRRQQYIKSVIEKFSDKKIMVFGNYKPWYKNPIKFLFREHRNIYMNRTIPYTEVNNYYNRSHVVLNIHHEQQKNGANPKVFEICGSGAYQVCDGNPYIESLFSNGEVGIYHNEQELIEKIKDAFLHDKIQNAEKANQIVSANHTFYHRMKELLSVVQIN